MVLSPKKSITPLTKLGKLGSERIQNLKHESRLMIISKHVISMRVLQKNSKSCQPRAENSLIKLYHKNFRFSLASNLSLKRFYLTRGFNAFCSCL